MKRFWPSLALLAGIYIRDAASMLHEDMASGADSLWWNGIDNTIHSALREAR